MAKIIVNQFISFDDVQVAHAKASERYVKVLMSYSSGKFNGWIPIEYRRTGLDLKSNDEISSYLISIYDYLDPSKKQTWFDEEEKYWLNEKTNAGETKKVFDALKTGEWICVNCAIQNPNWARRFQDLKEMGYTFATNTPVNCPKCGKRSTFIMCIHLPRYASSHGNGYETWSPKLRKRIISSLGSYDCYEGKVSSNLLPDHKFSEIRWDESTKEENCDDMPYQEIIDKFQLMTNQRNQQKREVCRKCFQTKERQGIFGINYFFQGTKQWDPSIPEKGKDAEKGCIGCPWHDIEDWREHIIKLIEKKN